MNSRRSRPPLPPTIVTALGRITHKMRGAAATLAAVRLAGAITGVELFLKYGDGGPLPELLADVRHESALFLGVVPQIVRRLTDGTARAAARLSPWPVRIDGVAAVR